MKYSITLLLALFVFFASQRVQAQQVIMSSSLTRDLTTGEMVGFSRTEMDFNTQAWYQAYVSNEIRRQSDNFLLASGEDFSAPGTDRIASKSIRTAGFPNTTYRLDSKHWILPLATGQCTFSRWDRYQFTNIGPPFIGGNYGATQTFFGFDGSGILCVPGWIYLGQTTQSKTVPNVTITNPRIGSIPPQSTQAALLGADIVLGSSVTPTGGSYSWTFTGPFSISGGSTSSSSVTIRSTDVGTITAKLAYTANGVQVAPQFTINVVIPTLQSFTGQQGSALVSPPGTCGFTDTFWRFKLGCVPSIPGLHFTTTVHAPNFISDPTQSGIKYVQAVSAYRKQVKGGNLLCSTRRSSPTDVASGWQLDTEDPYVFTEYPVRRFSEGNDLTMLTVDFPNQALTFIAPWEHVDALEIDDRFQMYVVYFTFDPRFPSISRVLGKLDWNFGGLVVFDRPGSHQIRSNYVTPRNITGEATTSMVTMQGNVRDNNMLPCPGASPITTNRIDATRYFVRQHYLDFLAREPDLDGWNWWTSEITECAFDLNCIHTERIHIGHAFFLVANSVLQDPDLANPPGTPGFNAATYNRAFVRHCYLNYLRREPDPEGWDHWTNELNSYGNYWHIIDAFQLAPQYRERFCTIC
jgi:Domain of unknown function (DUF4214)